MKLDTISSERLSILRFLLIIGVVFIHASNPSINNVSYFSNTLEKFISDGLARVSVPLFFMISGYLFFLGCNWSLDKYKVKLKSRFNSLVIPFLFWNITTLAVFFLVQINPTTSTLFSGNGQLISEYNSFDFINAIIGINRLPISFQFWFIRDLIIVIILSPIFALFFKRKSLSKIVLLCLLILWFFNLWPINIPSIASVMFFYTGAYLGTFGKCLFSLDKFGGNISYIYISILTIDCLTKGLSYNLYIHNFGILTGVISTLYISKIIHNNNSLRESFLKLSIYSFFVFAIHEPMLSLFEKIAYKVLTPNNALTATTIYILLPLITISIAILVQKTLAKLSPKTLSIISGGR
ncbi:acyltransferase [Vibrio harveyi]|nr:acyltransferase [Vibrio harveyi]